MLDTCLVKFASKRVHLSRGVVSVLHAPPQLMSVHTKTPAAVRLCRLYECKT